MTLCSVRGGGGCDRGGGGGGDGPGGGLFKKKIEDIHLYRCSCILVDIFAYYGSFAPKRHVDSFLLRITCKNKKGGSHIM